MSKLPLARSWGVGVGTRAENEGLAGGGRAVAPTPHVFFRMPPNDFDVLAVFVEDMAALVLVLVVVES